MKNIFLSSLLVFLFSFTLACEKDENNSEIYESNYEGCGTHNGHTLYKGPEGGCYYYNSNGNKTYVDRSECNC